MTLEELIRYAIDGVAIDDNLTQRDFTVKIQGLINILIDFGNITGKELTDILNKC